MYSAEGFRMNSNVSFDKLRKFIYEKSGISLSASKDALITARIGKRIRALNMRSYREYVDYVLDDHDDGELVQLLDVISTNVTSFFRESQHFDFLSEKISEWYEGGQRRFRIWSAACSTGEEPYSIAMVFNDTLEKMPADIRILATDISTRVLNYAIKGIYNSDKLKTINPQTRQRYFVKTDSDYLSIDESLKKMISFNRLNLSTPPFPMKGPFDIVFCRNVMIYFDNDVRMRLLEEIKRLLRPGGYLMVGHAENLTGMISSFKTVISSVYVKQ
jgi:chemotaxis protein methyltransferase CheR